jgi:hypothetical protein
MIDIKKYSLGELEVIYNDSYPKVQQWILDNMYLWFEKDEGQLL